MDCQPDGPGTPTRLYKCPFCTRSFIEANQIILQAHIQEHLDARRVPYCQLARRCHEYRPENSDQHAQHIMNEHLQSRQCKSNKNRVQRAIRNAILVKDGIIQRLANYDPNEIRPLAHLNALLRVNQQFLPIVNPHRHQQDHHQPEQELHIAAAPAFNQRQRR